MRKGFARFVTGDGMTTYDKQPRAGAMQVTEEDGAKWFANPHDVLYSSATMAASHFWNGKDWESIWPEETVNISLDESL